MAIRARREIIVPLACVALLGTTSMASGAAAGRTLVASVGKKASKFASDVVVTADATGFRFSGTTRNGSKSLSVACSGADIRSVKLPATFECGGSFTGVVRKDAGTWSTNASIALRLKAFRHDIAKGSFFGVLIDETAAGLPDIMVKKGRFSLRIESGEPSTECPTAPDQNNSHHRVYGDAIAVSELQQDETWTADNTYFILGNLDVGPHSLTIEQGTRVCLSTLETSVGREGRLLLSDFSGFGDDAIFGSLHVLGTENAHVTFGPMGSGNSGGIRLLNYATADFRYVDVLRSGNDAAAIELGMNGRSAVRFEHVRIVNARRRAFSALNPDGVAAGTTIVIEGVADSQDGVELVEVGGGALNSLTPGTVEIDSGVPADRRAILLTGRTVDHSLLLRNLGIPFRLREDLRMARSSMVSEAPLLTIEAGARLESVAAGIFVGGFGSYDSDGGDLSAVGTQDAPIVLTSGQAVPAAGDWLGVHFGRTTYDPAKSRMDHVIVEYAGGGEGVFNCRAGTDVAGGIEIERSGESLLYQSPPISNTVVANSAGDGIAVECIALHCGDTDYTNASLANSFSSLAGVAQQPLGCP